MRDEHALARLERDAQTRGRGLVRCHARAKQRHERLAAFGGDREPAQLGVANVAEPNEQRVTGARAQHLLGGPQRIAPSGRAHHRQVLERDACGGKRRRVRQVRRCKPDDAPPCAGERGKRRQHELQLADAFVQAEDLGERAGGPAAARQLAIERAVAARHNRGRWARERTATPHGLTTQDVFEAGRGNAHGVLPNDCDTVFLYSITAVGKT